MRVRLGLTINMNPDPLIRILVVEDNPLDAELMRYALDEQMSCRVEVVSTKSAFESELYRERPNIIVSDSNVQAFDGFEALNIATRKCPDIPFVFCSGSASEEKIEEGLLRGATSWVSKEDAFAQLVLVVKRLCGGGGMRSDEGV